MNIKPKLLPTDQKPRLRLFPAKGKLTPIWQCRGERWHCYGKTAEEAYNKWLIQIAQERRYNAIVARQSGRIR